MAEPPAEKNGNIHLPICSIDRLVGIAIAPVRGILFPALRPLKKFYAFLFVDCIYVTIRKEMETKNCAVYVVLGYDADGVKDVLGLWIGESEGKHYWMQIFDEIRARGVEDVLFISMEISRWLIPLAYMDSTLSSIPLTSFVRFGIAFGSKLPSLSLGTETSIFPYAVLTDLWV